MIHFKPFLSPGVQEPLQLPNNIIFYIRQLKKNILDIDPRKDHPGPFHSKAFVVLYKFETS